MGCNNEEKDGLLLEQFWSVIYNLHFQHNCDFKIYSKKDQYIGFKRYGTEWI